MNPSPSPSGICGSKPQARRFTRKSLSPYRTARVSSFSHSNPNTTVTGSPRRYSPSVLPDLGSCCRVSTWFQAPRTCEGPWRALREPPTRDRVPALLGRMPKSGGPAHASEEAFQGAKDQGERESSAEGTGEVALGAPPRGLAEETAMLTVLFPCNRLCDAAPWSRALKSIILRLPRGPRHNGG